VKPTSPFAYVNRAEMYLLQDQIQAAAQDLDAGLTRMTPQEHLLKRKAQALQTVVVARL
jgi:hypothetical protein